MSDALDIANLKARYCRAADAAAEDVAVARRLYEGIFTDDFVGEFGFPALHGPAALIDFMCEAISGGSDWMVHMVHSPSIEVDGDTARAEWTVLTHSSRRGSGERMVVLGRYADELRRTADGWRITRIVFTRIG